MYSLPRLDSGEPLFESQAIASNDRHDLKRAYMRQVSDDYLESIGKTKNVKAKSSSHEAFVETQRQQRASLAQARRADGQKDLEG